MDDRPLRKPNTADRDDDVVTTAVAGETVTDQVEGLGAILLLTPTRAILVRQGAHFRPRNGVREWALSGLRDAQLAPPRNGNGRIILRTGPYPWQAVSVFVAAQEWPAAERAVGHIRVRLAQARRSPTTNFGSRGSRPASDPPERV